MKLTTVFASGAAALILTGCADNSTVSNIPADAQTKKVDCIRQAMGGAQGFDIIAGQLNWKKQSTISITGRDSLTVATIEDHSSGAVVTWSSTNDHEGRKVHGADGQAPLTEENVLAAAREIRRCQGIALNLVL